MLGYEEWLRLCKIRQKTEHQQIAPHLIVHSGHFSEQRKYMLVQEGWFNVFLIVTAVDDFQRQSDT